MSTLADRLAEIARTPVLLVASDYDGTLSPIVNHPSLTRPDREALVALRRLSAMPQTHVAIISGRSLSDLATLTESADELRLVGSHGSEFDPDFASRLPPEVTALRDRLGAELAEIARRDPGFLIETKPAGVAFHYRNADRAAARDALGVIRAGPALYRGVHTRHGKMVIELTVVPTDKGWALDIVRHRVGATAAVFIGDDLTDEDAFATLCGPDLGVKVGPEESRASHRVGDTHGVSRLLAHLAELRAAWLAGEDAPPIEDHSMLTDHRSMALVSPLGRVTWLCLPRLDSQAIFAELLGGPTAGHFSVEPAGGPAGRSVPPPEQEYLGDCFVLRTRWEGGGGEGAGAGISVTDYLDCSEGRPWQRPGRTDLVRVIEGPHGGGGGVARVTFAPRLDFGRTPTRLRPTDDGIAVEGSLDPIVLRAPGVAWRIADEGRHQTATAEVALGAVPVVLELRYGTGSLREISVPERERRRQTEKVFAGWAMSLKLPRTDDARVDALVKRSALVLRGLVYGPTGAIAAAPTTSLPESFGGVRNWDYRYCWPRDAAMAANALAKLGTTGVAMKYLDWLLGVLDETPSPERLRPVYTVKGAELGPEGEIGELPGYRGSRPVRVGNAAAQQVQLDVFGPITDLVAVAADMGAPVSGEHWRLVEHMVTAVARRWREPDHGIWEVRAAQRHHVHSKVMCWTAVDRAIRLGERLLGREQGDWTRLRDQIASDVLEHGFKPGVNAFAATYDGDQPDAAALWIGLSGLLAPDDPRFIGTVEFIEERLREGPTVYRYRYDDGLPGVEGGFNICTSWLIESYALIGRTDDARQLFARYCDLAGRTGLLPEQYDPKHARGTGNHPQAYSHLGLINAAVRLDAR